jgi:hypothetical protein
MSDDTRPDPAQRYEDMDEKLVLVQILAELQAIRQAVTDADAPGYEGDDGPEVEKVMCNKCGTEVPRHDRERHAVERHKCPPSLADTIYQ